MKNLAIIPARSGSKGIKDKNVKMLNGKPLLAYSVEAAIKSGMFEEIMVTTDSEEYARIARECGAKVPFLRSTEQSSDTASSWDVVKEVLGSYKKMGREFDTVALLQPTSPLRTSEDILAGYKRMKEKDAKLVVAVCETDHSPLWSNTLNEDCSMVEFINPEVQSTPRQLLPIYYRINGALYIIDTQHLEHVDNIYSYKSFAVVMDKRKSVDIDDELDFMLAENIMRMSKE